MSERTDELAAPPGVADSAATLVVVWVGTRLEVVELTVEKLELEELVVDEVEVVVVVVGGGCQVLVVGDGSEVVTGIFTLVVDGEGEGEGEEPPEP